jgi:hypothetical protein
MVAERGRPIYRTQGSYRLNKDMPLCTSSSELRLQLAHLLCYVVLYCAVRSAEHLRHTSLEARVRACAVYSSDPLEPSPLTYPTTRPETGYIFTFGLPFEGS